MPQRIDVPGMGVVEFPDGMSDDQITAAIKANMQPQGGMTNEQADPAMDVGKSLVSGVGRGAIGVLGAPGDIGSLVSRGAEAIGVPEDTRRFAGKVFSSLPFTRPFAAQPGSQDIQRAVEQHTGEFYKPQTTAGRYAQTVGEFAPAAALPGGLASRAANVALPAVASEAVGQATEGTAAEPYARAGAALLGGAAASRVGRALPQRAAIPSADDRITSVGQSASRGYQSPEVNTAIFRPGAIDVFADRTLQTLDRSKFNSRRASETRAVLDDLRTPVNGVWHTVEDLQTAKEQLGRLAGNFANPVEAEAARRASNAIKDYIGSVRQADLAVGDASALGKTWTRANADYAVAKTAGKVQEKLYAAQLQAGSANTGANLGNASRQKLRPLLTNAKQGRGITDSESELIEQTVQGSRLANALRSMGDATGGGGGARSMLAFLGGGGAGAMAGLGPLGFALPLVGSGLRGAANAVTKRQANSIVDAILDRAPSMEGIKQRGQEVLSDRQRRALIAQLSLASMPVIRQPSNQPR